MTKVQIFSTKIAEKVTKDQLCGGTISTHILYAGCQDLIDN